MTLNNNIYIKNLLKYKYKSLLFKIFLSYLIIIVLFLVVNYVMFYYVNTTLQEIVYNFSKNIFIEQLIIFHSKYLNQNFNCIIK